MRGPHPASRREAEVLTATTKSVLPDWRAPIAPTESTNSPAASWWRRLARTKMAELLTAAEDRLERARARAEVADRVAIRAARRLLESEVSP